MASAQTLTCSPWDIYTKRIDTSKILIAKTFEECLPEESEFISVIEHCCSNTVTATYRHKAVDQLAITLFQYPLTDIQLCQEGLKKKAPDVFVFEIESRPEGLVVLNSDAFQRKQLISYIKNRKSGIGPEAKPEVLHQEDDLLIVRVRNTEKVLRQVCSRSHTISGQPVYFEPYFPCFHDTLTELLGSSDRQSPVQPFCDTTVYSRNPYQDIPYPDTPYPDTPYPDTEPDQDPYSSPRLSWPSDRSYSPIDGIGRSYSPEDEDGHFDYDNNYHPPGDRGRGDDYYPPGHEGRGAYYPPPGDGRRGDYYPPPGDGGRGDDYYPPGDEGRDDYDLPPGDGGRGDGYYSPGDGGRGDYYPPSGDGGRGDGYYSPGDEGEVDYYLPPRVGGRDDRHHSPGGGRRPVRYDSPGDKRHGDRHYSPSIDNDLEEDGGNWPKCTDATEDDDLTKGVKETIKIKTSSICNDDEEKKMVSVGLESSIGKQFLKQFQKDNECEIDVKFKKKTIKPVEAHSTTDTTSSTKGRKSTSGALVQRSPCILRDKQIKIVDPELLLLGMVFPGIQINKLVDEDTSDTRSTDQDRANRQSRSHPADRSDTITINGTKVTVKKGDVSREKADVLVNVVGEDLELQTGLISKAYAKRGGDGLTQAYQSALLRYDDKGMVVCDGGKLSCKHLITMVLSQRKDSSSDQKFSVILKSVFQKTADLGLGTIVLPVMGCGKMLQYPLHTALAIIMDNTSMVLKSSKNNLKEVTIVAFDDKTYDELAKELRGKGPPKSTKTAASQPRASVETVGCSIELSAYSSKLKRLTKELTRALKATFLSTNNVGIPNSISIRTKTKLYKIAEEHTKMPMKMEFDQSGKHIALQGEKTQVSKTAKHLTSMLSSGDSNNIRKTIRCSPSSWYKLAHDSPISPPYWTKFEANTPLTVVSKNSRATKRWALVPVGAPTKKAIQNLVQSTWDNKLVGQGRDAVNLKHKRIKVDKVERIENIDVYSRYATKRQDQFRILAEDGAPSLRSLEDINVQTKGAIATSPKDGSILYEDIFPEINEHYLFHGTKPEIVDTVIKQGLDCRMSNEKAMFGMGIYGAETSTKADQYTDNKQQRSPGSKRMLLVRMLLGNMFVCKDTNPTKYRRPPCRNTKCLRDTCTSGHVLFDSVVGDGHWLFREFVVYAAEQCYPEYLITYHRE